MVKLELGSHIVTKRSSQPNGVGTNDDVQLSGDVEMAPESTFHR